MIIYRPHRSTLDEAMKEAMVFNSEREMFEHIVKQWDGLIGAEDLSISEPLGDDERIGWKDCRYVLTNRCGNRDYIKLYGCTQCIGMCAYEWGKEN